MGAVVDRTGSEPRAREGMQQKLPESTREDVREEHVTEPLPAPRQEAQRGGQVFLGRGMS